MQDLNPQPPTPWTLAEGPYELADYCVQNKTRLLILLCAWLDSKEELKVEHDWHTLKYWAARLRPLWTKIRGETFQEEDEETNELDTVERAKRGEETIVVVCNRSGEENGTDGQCLRLIREY
jgi:protein N-terminal amidase